MTEQEPTLLSRALGVVTDVRPKEALTALLLTLNVFLLMTAYLAIKPVREGLILVMPSGPEYKSYMGGAIAITLLFAVPAYARFADRLPRNRLVVGVTLFFASHLVLFWLGSSIPAVRSRLGLLFYLWVGIFNMMVVAQFWSFANDLYDEEQGKRLFPLLGVGQTVGALAGNAIAAFLLEVLHLGVYQMLLFSAALLAASAFLTQVVHTRESHRKEGATEQDEDDTQEKKGIEKGAFRLVFKNRYLLLIAAFSVVFTFVNSNGEYMLGRLVKEHTSALVAAGDLAKASSKEYITTTFNRFYLYVGICTVVLQTLVVSRLIKHGGLKVAFFVLPFIALGDATAVVIAPVLAILFVGKIAENSTDYSVNNTVRNMLWLPTTRAMKYKAKQAIDTFFVRMGDVSSALLVFLGAGLSALRWHLAGR